MKVDKELGLSIFYILFGSIFAFGGTYYHMGSLEQMGSGYWPTLVGITLVIIGVLNYIRSILAGNSQIITIKIKIPLIIASLFVMTYFITKYVGFLTAISVLIWGSAMLHPEFSAKKVLIVNIVCIVISVVMKYTLLKMLPL